MKTRLTFSLLAAAAFLLSSQSVQAGRVRGAQAEKPARVPVLLELFTSEGCSSCPPADELLRQFERTQPAPSAELIVLSEHVDYWDGLGWRDPFSSPLLTRRQNQYASRFGLEAVYTPELVVDGDAELVGGNREKALAAIRKAAARPKIGLALSEPTRKEGKIELQAAVDNLPAELGKADLYLAVVQKSAQSRVSRGENAGSTLSHSGVVRAFAPVAHLKPGERFNGTVGIPLPGDLAAAIGTKLDKGIKIVAFVQGNGTARVVAVAQTEAP